MNKRIRKAIFPVGGLGVRFLPATKALPKEMLPVVDRPLIQYAVDEARDSGIEEFIFVTGRGKTAIENHFDYSFELLQTLKDRNMKEEIDAMLALSPNPGQIAYVRQQEPLGLGHAVWCARHLIGDEPFAVILADDLILAETPCLRQMLDVFEEMGGNILATMEVPDEHTSRYGIVDADLSPKSLRKIKGLIEKPKKGNAPSNIAIIGRYILLPEIFNELGKKKVGEGGEIQLTDALSSLIGTQPFYGLDFSGKRFDCGVKLGYLEANIAFALERQDLGPSLRKVLTNYGF
ncbi:MAG: UTP--glucose-1-phosphate uridylyltransferase [Rhodospirillales bacterium]|nr:UTP--glucose-1-phosphate uridylyltransferase [Rhodospirillales bacterium]